MSPALMRAAGPGLILGQKIEAHAKGMPDPLECHELLGHEDHPQLALDRQEAICATLAEPQALQYVRLSGKHLHEPMQAATLVDLSRRRGVLRTSEPLQPYADLMFRVSPAGCPDQILELYAKVIGTIDEADRSYLVHFTSIPPEARAWLRQLHPVKS